MTAIQFRSRLLGLLLAYPTACATMRYGSTQVVTISTNPPGATVHIKPGNEEVVTPSQVVLARRHSYVLRVEKSGYEVESVVLQTHSSSSMWRNLVWIHPFGLLIGVIVDVSTGSGFDLYPEAVDLTLKPTSGNTTSG